MFLETKHLGLVCLQHWSQPYLLVLEISALLWMDEQHNTTAFENIPIS